MSIKTISFGAIRGIHYFKQYEVIEYYPYVYENGHKVKGKFEEKSSFLVEHLHESFPSFDIAVIGILCREYQGANHHLTYPIARMLEMIKEKE